jgi:hypothetical protein
MTDDVKQEREAIAAQFIEALEDTDWELAAMVRENAETIIEALRDYQPNDALKIARDALENAPIIGLTESAVDFRKRQDLWAYGQWKAAIKALKESK